MPEDTQMTTWRNLDDELALWADAGDQATLWWRDDDVIEITPDLEKLLSLQAVHKIPLVLAAVPAMVKPGLSACLNRASGVSIFQHGFAHQSRSAEGEKSSEFPSGANNDEMLGEINEGWELLEAFQFREKVFVPPWNRIAESLYPGLAVSVFAGLSTFGPRASINAAPHLKQMNTHVDIIDWRGTRGFAGEQKVLGDLVKHLSDRRHGNVDASEPTGLLTHHLVHDQACWQFLERFLSWTDQREDVIWVAAQMAFRP